MRVKNDISEKYEKKIKKLLKFYTLFKLIHLKFLHFLLNDVGLSYIKLNFQKIYF
jgi:hypothetical protein